MANYILIYFNALNSIYCVFVRRFYSQSMKNLYASIFLIFNWILNVDINVCIKIRNKYMVNESNFIDSRIIIKNDDLQD